MHIARKTIARNTVVFRLVCGSKWIKVCEINLGLSCLETMWPQSSITNTLEYTLRTCVSYTYKIHNCCTHAPVWRRLNGVYSLLVWSVTSPVENIADGLRAPGTSVNLACCWDLWQIISGSAVPCLRILWAIIWDWGPPAAFSCWRWNMLIVSIYPWP